MKIVGFAGSNSKNSINKQFVNHTLKLLSDAETELLDLNDFELPIFSVDREEKEGYPENMKKFLDIIQSADGLVISLAEHNGAYAAVFKNLIDWCSRYELKFFKEIPVLLLSTSPGGYGGGNVMELALNRLPKFEANIIAHFSLPKFKENFSENKGITEEDLNDKFKNAIEEFLNHIE